MSAYIPEKYRTIARERAAGLCEYCLFHESHAYFPFEIDHIISLKHGGETEPDNLALACFFCNRNKGSDIGSVLLPSREFIRFFNPRVDRWPEHFQLEEAFIQPLTPIGEATAKILDFNHADRIIERQMLLAAGRFPHPEAKTIKGI
ncbi:MAG: HNH endonuclease [Verrucomicrobiae bacterium]|nr:HNH endonuclease [Verrucomicrobiae bacterium]